ncbi:MAG: arginyltransferase [Candidatus Melainabacteria bacterium]|nr:arginyltransferase [Candidatus Melainabacteria bacterium]
MKLSKSLFSEPEQCGYLPDQQWRFEYKKAIEMTSEEYTAFIHDGWRKFGRMLFRPICNSCSACQPIRVRCAEFSPDRSQKRTLKANEDLQINVSHSGMDKSVYDLYMSHHEARAQDVGWRKPTVFGSLSHLSSMEDNPFAIQVWKHKLNDRLVGVCFVEPLSDGYSAIYSFYDPDEKKRSLGTWMILNLIEKARIENLPFVYLGYYVEGCRSMSYKSTYFPSEIRNEDGSWSKFKVSQK